MKVLQITLLCLCLFLISSVVGLKLAAIGHHQLGCPYNGVKYIPGATFCIGCNLCVCHSNGLISCKKGQCCKYKGKFYKPGAVIVINGRKYQCINGKWKGIKYPQANVELSQRG